MNTDHSSKNFCLGALLGELVGGVTALLFAPKSGKQMRRALSEAYDEVSEKAHNLVHDTEEKAKEWKDRGKEALDEAKDKGKELFKNAKKE